MLTLHEFKQQVSFNMAIGICRFPISPTYDQLNDQFTAVYKAWISDYDRLIIPKFAQDIQDVIVYWHGFGRTGSIYYDEQPICLGALTKSNLESECERLDLEIDGDKIAYSSYFP